MRGDGWQLKRRPRHYLRLAQMSMRHNAVLTGKLRAQRVIYPCAALCYALFMLLILRHAENQRICLEFSYYAQLPVVPQIRCKQ